MCDHHGEDEQQEEAVVGPADAAVQEKAVVVVVLDAHVAQLAVSGEVWEEELLGWGGAIKEEKSLKSLKKNVSPSLLVLLTALLQQ